MEKIVSISTIEETFEKGKPYTRVRRGKVERVRGHEQYWNTRPQKVPKGVYRSKLLERYHRAAEQMYDWDSKAFQAKLNKDDTQYKKYKKRADVAKLKATSAKAVLRRYGW